MNSETYKATIVYKDKSVFSINNIICWELRHEPEFINFTQLNDRYHLVRTTDVVEIIISLEGDNNPKPNVEVK